MKKGEEKLLWRCRDLTIEVGPVPLIMGVLNVTPDSFSDGGRYFDRDTAVASGLKMSEEGADIIDVGGESTRPGALSVGIEEEIERVIPVIRKLHGKTALPISIDTRKAAVAEEAIHAGARIINDISALTHDPDMVEVARRHEAGVILMHMRGEPRTMQDSPQYEDVVREVTGYLKARVENCVCGGLDPESLAVDPGIGFGKTVEHNVQLLVGLQTIRSCGRPVVVGVSRKSFLGKITGRPVEERLAASLAVFAYCVLRGAHIMRVHDVKESRDAALVIASFMKEEACLF